MRHACKVDAHWWQIALLLVGLRLVLPITAAAQDSGSETAEVPPFPNDLSISGLEASTSQTGDSTMISSMMAPEVLNKLREYAQETYKLGRGSRAGILSVSAAPTNVRANNPAGDAIGETQSEVAVAVYGDTVVVGFNDSKGFLAGFTVSSYAYSIDGGATFTDGGNVPLAAAGDQAFGDPGVDTDEKGNWYFNQIYTRTGQQNIAVHHGRFVAGVLVWDSPVQASIGTSGTGLLDKCLLACDRLTGNVYVSYTRFTATPRIEVVRSTNQGVGWAAPIVLDNTSSPTASKQAARPFCGPNGEVYVVWEKGANYIFCPDGSGNLSNTTGLIGFARSMNFGVSYDPFISIGTVDHSWTWSGPGDLRERANDFPDIAVDRSGGPFNGNIYVTWHESAPWTSNLSAGPVRAEAANVANNNPGGAESFLIGENVTGSSSSTADLDYWQFSATAGQSLLFNLDPQGFVCGVSGTTRGMRMRLFATQSPYPNPNGFPDTLIAASAIGAFAQRIVWTAPKTGTYLVRLQPSTTAIGTYTLRVRNLTFGAPNPARDARDVVVVRSTDLGSTWSAEQLVNDDPAGLENRRPFIAVDGLGRVYTFWHDSRLPGLGSNAALTHIFGTISTDGGVTWSPNYVVTDEPSFYSFNTLAVPNLGDYNQAAATTGGLVHPAWSDQRLSTGDVRIPNSNSYSAGLGPETYTTALSPPSIACPSNISKDNDPGSCSAVVTFTVSSGGSPTPTVTCTPSSGSAFPVGTTTVNCSATNGIGYSATCSFTVTVTDTEPPAITSVSASPSTLWPPNHTMRDVTVNYTSVDNCGSSTCALSVSTSEPENGTGDGDASPDYEVVDDHHVRLRAERAGSGDGRVYTIAITCTDANGNSATQNTTVIVSHNITGPLSGASFKIGTPVTFSGTFWDVAGKTHTAQWVFDNLTTSGTVVEPNGSMNGTVSGSYAFTSAGVYKVTLKISDNTGTTSWVSTQGDLEAIVVIYDPNGGYAIGGGWIASAPGSYPAVPSASGKVSFGFASKYFKNATNPKGETQFEFKLGTFEFNSLNYDYLAVSGSKAQFKGWGKSSTGFTYNFVLTVRDGQLSNGGGVDKLRMKIYAKTSGQIIYDNQPGSSDAADPTTPVGDGSSIAIQSTGISASTSPGEEQETGQQALPVAFALYQNYPNPFNPITRMRFDLPKDSRVSLIVYNSLGEEMLRLVESERSAGHYTEVWDGTNTAGRGLASGIYFYKLLASPLDGSDPYVRVMKTMLMK